MSVLVTFVMIIALLVVVFIYRLSIGIYVETRFNDAPELITLDNKETGEWFDEYYTVEAIDTQTYAIGEPRYHQENFHYLLIGEQRALLFDSGVGIGDLGALIKSITNLPVTVLPSHLHYDHVGGCEHFKHVALVDLPNLRAQEKSGELQLTNNQHLGQIENVTAPILKVTQWIKPNEEIDLGNRKIKVLHTPGHTNEHIALFDQERNRLFTSDYLYDGPLLGFLPGADLEKYLKTTEFLLSYIPKNCRLFGAHRSSSNSIPEIGYQDLIDLQQVLQSIKIGENKGKGFYPRSFTVNEKLTLLTDIPWLIKW